MTWQPIETAPKDGSWIIAYRPAAPIGSWEQVVTVAWSDAVRDFVWPDYMADPQSPFVYPDFDEWLDDAYEGGGSFTHWMPVPEEPET